MQDYWWWWGLAVLFGVLEMVTTTFYLLVLGIGFAVGGLVAYLGGDFALQLVGAAAFSFVGWFLLRRFSPRRARVAAHGSRDVLLDIGERVRVERWQADRRAQVLYRGAAWSAELVGEDSREPEPGEYVIRRIEGNRLIVARPG
jgi:membrane protein implicated in regulation of membrane protease activity